MADAVRKPAWQLGQFETTPVCVWCLVALYSVLPGDPERHDHRTRDHVIPRARGGLDRQNNVVGACRLCNTLRADMPADEYGALAREHIAPVRYDLGLLRDQLAAAGLHRWSGVVERVRVRSLPGGEQAKP